MTVLTFGETIWDIYPDEKIIGGAPFNFAAHLAHLGNSSYLMSAVGNDELGENALFEAKKHGIKTDFILRNEYPTGSCMVTLDENAVPSYNVLTDTAYDNISADDGIIDRIKLLSPDVFYFNTLIQRNSVSAETLKIILRECKFNDIFCDINLRKACFDKASLLLCLENATMLKVSDEESKYLYELGLIDGNDIVHDIAERYKNIRLVIYTLGKDGSVVLDTVSGKLYRSDVPKPERVVSTVGAGDCYGAAFLSEYVAKKSIDVAIALATERCNIVVANKAAVPF